MERVFIIQAVLIVLNKLSLMKVQFFEKSSLFEFYRYFIQYF